MDSCEKLWYDILNGWQGASLSRYQSAAWEDVRMAGRRNRYGYQEYRGRGSGRSVLIFIIALLAVLLVAGMAFMFILGDYIRYTATGIEIDWPWRYQEPSALPVSSDPVVIDTGNPAVTEEPTSEPTAEPTAEPTSEPTAPPVQYDSLTAVTVTTDQLRFGSAAQAVVNAGGNALVVEMKANTSKLAWQSQTGLAASLNVNAANNRVADAIRELAQSGNLYLIARVHCFKDPALASSARIGSLMTRGGNVWHDYYGVSWSSPANQQAVDYLSALCLELADMGFDEILLDDAGYPCEGEVNVLATDNNRPEDRTVPVAAFLHRIAGELREKDVCLSVYASEKLAPGNEVYSGMTAEVLAQNVGRVWLDKQVDRTYYESLLSAAGMDDLAARVVVPGAASTVEGGSRYQ